jgi:hypothetical protein
MQTLAVLALDNGALWAKILTITGLLIGLYIVALWVALAVWAYRDASERMTDERLRYGATALVALFNIPGFLLYLAVRPPELLVDRYNRQLEAEALLHEIERDAGCPSCGLRVEPGFVACPHCRTRLQDRCASCDRYLRTGWTLCPYCGGDRSRQPATAATAASPPMPRAASPLAPTRRPTSPRPV